MSQNSPNIWRNWKLLVVCVVGLLIFAGPAMISNAWPLMRRAFLIAFSLVETVIVAEMIELPGFPAWFYTSFFLKGIQGDEKGKLFVVAASLLPAMQIISCMDISVNSFQSIGVGVLGAAVLLLFDLIQRASTERTLFQWLLYMYIVAVLGVEESELESRLSS